MDAGCRPWVSHVVEEPVLGADQEIGTIGVPFHRRGTGLVAGQASRVHGAHRLEHDPSVAALVFRRKSTFWLLTSRSMWPSQFQSTKHSLRRPLRPAIPSFSRRMPGCSLRTRWPESKTEGPSLTNTRFGGSSGNDAAGPLPLEQGQVAFVVEHHQVVQAVARPSRSPRAWSATACQLVALRAATSSRRLGRLAGPLRPRWAAAAASFG